MTTPEVKADRLTAALRENTDALRHVKNRYRWSLVLSAFLAFTLAVVILFNYQGNVNRCESGNDLRGEIDDKLQSLGDFLTPLVNDNPANQEFIALLTEDFPRRDCSDVSWLGG
jgi:hypothetical protein